MAWDRYESDRGRYSAYRTPPAGHADRRPRRRVALILLAVILLPLLWHLYLTSLLADTIRERAAASTDAEVRADVSVNPVTNLVTIKLAPPADSSHANPFAGLGIALGKALLQTFGPDLVERELNTRAREQYDLYAMLIPYRVRIAMQQPSAAQIADSGDKRRQQTDDGSKAKQEQVEKARRAREAEVAQRKELAAYISKYVTLQDVRVAPAERFGRPELGAFATVVNRGTRTLNKVEVRIYFLDSSGRRIAEKDFPAVFVSQFSSAEQAPLRPHYRKDFGVRLHDAPSGWAQRIEMEVVDIEFADKQR